jgi:predicted amidohydrolase
VRIAALQIASPPGETVAARRDRVAAMVAGARGADLIVLPELWANGYFAFDSYAERAEPLDGDTVTAAREWARALDSHLHLGSFLERSADGALHNTAALIDPTGAILHAYRKIHVFGYRSREAQLVSPGTEVAVSDTALGDAGARGVVAPAAWPAARVAHWRVFTTCRAIEEQVLLVACNGVGSHGEGGELGGHSRVVDPWGEVLAEAGTEECVLEVEVEMAAVERARADFPVLEDRRIGVDPKGGRA